jgi:hypothetical protein
VLPKKTENNIVTGSIELRFGDAATLAGQREAAAVRRQPADVGHQEPYALAVAG